MLQNLAIFFYERQCQLKMANLSSEMQEAELFFSNKAVSSSVGICSDHSPFLLEKKSPTIPAHSTFLSFKHCCHQNMKNTLSKIHCITTNSATEILRLRLCHIMPRSVTESVTACYNFHLMILLQQP